MATKTATVNASSVAATLTNYPTYIDLARVGVTTLAEAQSVRVYSDSGLSTELAREIVSVNEMHVLIPSLTTTTELYVDYDGVRSDYAVTDTFGRNAVWADYKAVLHLDEASGSAVDSVGTTNWTATGASGNTPGSATGQIEGARDFVRANNEHFIVTKEILDGMSAVTISYWFNQTANTDPQFLWSFNREGNVNDSFSNWALIGDADAAANMQFGLEDTGNRRNIMNTATTFSLSTWYMAHNTWDGSTLRTFIDGTADVNTASATNYVTFGDTSTNKRIGSSATGAVRAYDGVIDEFRVRQSYVGADWVTTEYNNQSDEATFWGTWTDAGGGVVAPQFKGFSRL